MIRQQFRILGLSDNEGMALLADSNTISDNCITVEDIAQADIPNAVAWLQSQQAPE